MAMAQPEAPKRVTSDCIRYLSSVLQLCGVSCSTSRLSRMQVNSLFQRNHLVHHVSSLEAPEVPISTELMFLNTIQSSTCRIASTCTLAKWHLAVPASPRCTAEDCVARGRKILSANKTRLLTRRSNVSPFVFLFVRWLPACVA